MHADRRLLLTLVAALSLAACSGGDPGGQSGPGGDGTGGGDGGIGSDGNEGNDDPNDGSDGPNGDAGLDASIPMGCRDIDEDGFGLMCTEGPDCDDANPAIGGYEICDGKDNDCDGEADEFLTDVCTTCNESCAPVPSPDNATGWVEPAKKPPEDVKNVIIDDEGAITLSRDEAQAHSVWVANSGDGTVSKLDSRTNVELARYVSVRTEGLGPLGSSPPYPSRTAVDQRFDAYVANRAHGNGNNSETIGTVTKYGNKEDDCIDRNMNGTIETSRDINMDGRIDTDPIAGEFLGEDDECILWTVKVGRAKASQDITTVSGVGSWPRALAVGIAPPDGDVGDVYVGLNGDNDNHDPEVCRLDAGTGAILACVYTGGYRPYGAAADSNGRVWIASREGSRGIGFVDAGDAWNPISTMPQCGSTNAEPYGITVDADNRVYLAHSNCTTEQAFRYDHDNNTGANNGWEKVSVPDGGTGRGVAVDREHFWVAISGDGTNNWQDGNEDRIVQFSIANALTHLETFNMPHGRSAMGVGVSFDGSVWAISDTHGGDNDPFGDSGNGVASRLDRTIAEGMPGRWIEREVGVDPYTYSDFIGFGLNTFADPRGFYRYVIQGCPAETTHWRGVIVDAKTPPMTSVSIRVRSADKKEELAAQPWAGPYEGKTAAFGDDVPDGTYLEVEVALATDDQSVAPQVFGVEVVRECEGVVK